MSEISSNARKMREYIDKNGWIQGAARSDYEISNPSVCLIGSYRLAVSEHAPLMCDATMQAIKEFNNAGIAPWNDTEDRTKQQVLDMLENVAIKYDDDAYTSGANDDTV